MSSANAASAQQFANRAASGQPLDVLMQQFGQVEAQELLNLIMSEIQQGINPRQMARDITGALDQIDYGRAETIARTESLGSWNDAALANYNANSDIVGSWMWMCFPGAGTCVGCLEEDGTIYGLDEELNDHPNGRCVKAPITNDYGAILSDYGIDTVGMDFGLSPWDDRQTGEQWLLAQDEATQIAAFGGKAPYYAWKSGDVPLKAFTKHVHDPVWGDHVAQQSLKGMGLNARDYAEGTIKERLAQQAAQEAYAATPIGQAEARLAVAEQRARELEAMMAQAFATGAARDAVLEDYYHTVLVQRLTAQYELDALKAAQAAGEDLQAALAAADREAEAAAAREAEALAPEAARATLQDAIEQALSSQTREEYAREVIAPLADRLKGNPEWDRLLAKANAGDLRTLNAVRLGRGAWSTDERAVRDLIERWNMGSLDGPEAIAMKLAAIDEFSLTNDLASVTKDADLLARVQADFGDALGGVRAFLRAMYDQNQEWFAARGIETLRLYRGLSAAEAPGAAVRAVTAEVRPISSFTADLSTAAEYASRNGDLGRVYALDVPVSDVIATPLTGLGVGSQYETLLLGGQYDGGMAGDLAYYPGTLEAWNQRVDDLRQSLGDFLDRLTTPEERQTLE